MPTDPRMASLFALAPPAPMLAFTAVIMVALAGAVHGPRSRLARGVYAVVLALMSLAGGGIAAWQSWIQRFPPDLSECGPDLAYMLESFPLASALPMIFHGAGECTRVDWSFLGLSIANWSLLLLLLLLLRSRFSRVRVCVTPWTAAHQAPQSLGFSRQEHWSGLPCPPPMHESEM